MDLRYFAVDTEMDVADWVAAIRTQVEQVKINFDFAPIDEQTIKVSVPDASPACTLAIGQIDNEFPNRFSDYDLPEAGSECLQKKILLTLTGHREERAVNFIFNLVTKALGPITKGTMIDVEQAYVTDDWVTWGYDYITIENFDMFEMFQSAGLDEEYPALRLP